MPIAARIVRADPVGRGGCSPLAVLPAVNPSRIGCASGLPDGASGVLAAVAAYGAQARRRARASLAATRHRGALEALMRLRAEFEGGDTTPTPDKYLDLSYGQRALSSVN